MFARVNIQCSESSNSSASFDRALVFAQAAYRLIGPDLEELPEVVPLSRAVYLNYVIALYRLDFWSLAYHSTAKYTAALELCRTFYSKKFCNKDFEMQFIAHECRILIYMGQNLESIARGLEALSLLGLQLPSFLKDPSLVGIYETELMNKIKAKTEGIGILEFFKRLPILTDDFIVAAHSIIIELTAPLAYSAPHLFHSMSLLGLSLTLEHGKSMHAAFHVR